MKVELFKKIVEKDGKTYTNFYIKLDSGKKIPINVANVVDKEGKKLNNKDFSILSAIATQE